MIKGNYQQQNLLREALSKGISPILVTGPYGIGKCSFVMNWLTDNELDFISVDCESADIDSLTACKSNPERAVLFDNFSDLSLLSQDCLLKWCEESNSRVVFVSESTDTISPTILSRCRYVSHWDGLSDEDLAHFSETVRMLCGNSYAVATRISSSEFFKNYYDQLMKVPPHEFFRLLPLPKLEHRDEIRALISVFRLVARNRPILRGLLGFEGHYTRSKHVNVNKSVFSLLS